MRYEDFLAQKAVVSQAVGIPDPPELSPMLFPFQRDIARWALRRGRAAVFAECGLGKGWISLEWARVVAEHTGRPVLILAPLAVAQQFIREGAKLGVSVRLCREPGDLGPGLNVTNYERVERFEDVVAQLGGVVLDESSILKAQDGKTRNLLISMFAPVPFRLACTATPAPNDHEELGNHSEFLGIMTRTEMLSMFFVHDGETTQEWRLKGHAEHDFWRWVCSWAVALSSPADLGYDATGYDLPPLHIHEHVIDCDTEMARAAGMLFAFEARTLSEERAARKASLAARVSAAAALVNAEPDQPWLVWCDLNDESAALAKAIPGAVEVTGADECDWKENAALWFSGYEDICPKCQSLRSGAHTTEHGSKPTESASKSTDRRPKTSAMRGVESCTPQRLTDERRPDGSRPSGRKTTQTSDSLSVSSRTGSPRRNTSRSSRDRAEVARSAEELPAQTVSPSDDASQEADDSTSITVTKQEPSGVCSAHHATWDSASSETIQTSSQQPPNTCVGCGRPRILISKGRIFGFGVNFQNCARAVFVGLSHSFEMWHQANRRIWRFGQRREVHSHVVTSSAEGRVVANIKRKQVDAERMVRGMVEHMADITRAELRASVRMTVGYEPTEAIRFPEWLKEERAA